MKQQKPQNWDRDQVWLNIEEALRRKKKRRALLIFWFGSTGLMLGIASLFLLSSFPKASYAEVIGQLPIPLKPSAGFPIVASNKDTHPDHLVDLSKSSKLEDSNFSTPVITSRPTQLEAGNVQLTSPQKIEKEISPSQALIGKTSGEISLSPEFPPVTAKISAPFPTIVQYISRVSPLASLSLGPLRWPEKPEILSALDLTAPARNSSFYLRFSTKLSSGQVQLDGTTAWLSAKKESETFSFAATQTLGLDWYFKPSWYAFAGISYQAISTSYDYRTTQESIRNITSDSATVFQFQGQDPIYQSGTLQETTTTERWIVHNNLLHRWSIPLGLGFTKSFKRYAIEARLGTRLHFSQQFEGIVLDELNQQHVVDNVLHNRLYYKDQLDVGLMSAFSLHYRFNRNQTLLLGFHYEKDRFLSLNSSVFRS